MLLWPPSFGYLGALFRFFAKFILLNQILRNGRLSLEPRGFGSLDAQMNKSPLLR
jgi:hypothetical protein